MGANRSLATVSDSLGNVLFYTDGNYVYDRTNSYMPNGTGLLSMDADQSVCVVQNIWDDNLFYIFTINGPGWPPPVPNGGLHYSVVDMTLNGGLGDIVTGQKNISLLGNSNYPISMTMARHHNNKDAWLIIHNALSNHNFYAFLITSGGIQGPVVSSSTMWAPNIATNEGSMKVSPDGTKLIAPYEDSLECCHFNSSTGKITHLFSIHADAGPLFDNGWSYLEFSIDSKYLYRSGEDWNNARIYQYDATLEDSVHFAQSETYVGHSLHGVHLQMGPDWKIYGDESIIDSMCVINKPATGGIGCNFQANAVYLNLWGCGHGLPQFLQKYKAYLHHSGQCQWDSIHFSGDIWPPADSIHWDFGDPASGPANYSNLPNSSHIYNTSGSFTVELFVRHIDNRTDTSWQTITIVSSPQISLGPDRTICNGDSTTFDAGACSGCTYVWKDLGSGLIVGTSQTFKTGLAGGYAVTVTGANGCNGHDTVQLMTTPIPLVTNSPLSKNICSGDFTNITLTSNLPGTIFTYVAIPLTGGVTGWIANGTGPTINQQLFNWLTTPGLIEYQIVPQNGLCLGPPVDYLVTIDHGDSIKVSISPSANNICAGTPVSFTSIPVNGGTNPTYKWFVNSVFTGITTPNYSFTPANNDVVNCELTSSIPTCISNNPATSNSITMTVNPNLPVSVTIAPNANPICAGTLVTFTATPVNGGTTPAYTWKVNGITIAGANLSTYSYIPANGDLVNCILTSSEICTSGNPASSIQHQVFVSPNLPGSITITASANPFCLGSSVTFTATPTNGGTTPSYLWKVNGINSGTNSPNYTYIPANNDQVSCILTSTELCTSGNPASSIIITMIQNNSLPASVNITPTSNPFCPGSSVTFTASPVNGGTTPSYIWKVNGNTVGTNSPTYSYNPANNDSVRCIMTSNLTCVTGSPASSSKIIMSGTLAPVVTFTSCFDTITRVNAKPIKLKGGIPLGGTYSGPGVNSVTGVFTPALAGAGTHIITYSYTNVVLCTATKSISILILPSSILPCGNPLTDPRDNKVYQTVQIGSQCWMAEDLNYGTEIPNNQDQRDNCITEKYHNPASSIQHPASVYQWDELMTYDDTPADQGFCPPGWHIPSENDWNILFATYTNSGFAGSPLKYSGYSGFNALLSGVRDIKKGWEFQGFATFFWSSTPTGDAKAWAHGMNDADPSVSAYPALRVNAYPVRCLKD